MSEHASQEQATTRASAWTWVGVLVALGGPALAVAAKRSGYFGSDVGSHILNWFALWGAALLTLLILVVGDASRFPRSDFGASHGRASALASRLGPSSS
jgi:hypothetical protein